MDWQGFIQAIGDIVRLVREDGLPIVLSVIAVVVVLLAGWWIKTIVDRKVVKDEERRDKDDARKDLLTEAVAKNSVSSEVLSEGIGVIAKQTERQTELMERMDRRTEDQGRQIQEHGVKIDRMHRHLFKEGSGDA